MVSEGTKKLIEAIDYIVLILVLVEDGLGETMEKGFYEFKEERLNPCFSGGWSRRETYSSKPTFFNVLILVLVEDGLGAHFLKNANT